MFKKRLCHLQQFDRSFRVSAPLAAFEFMKYFCEFGIFVELLSLRISQRNWNAGPSTF